MPSPVSRTSTEFASAYHSSRRFPKYSPSSAASSSASKRTDGNAAGSGDAASSRRQNGRGLCRVRVGTVGVDIGGLRHIKKTKKGRHQRCYIKIDTRIKQTNKS